MSTSNDVEMIEFFDEESSDFAFVCLRRCGDRIGLCISLRSNGDVEVFLDRNLAVRLIGAIEKALKDDG